MSRVSQSSNPSTSKKIAKEIKSVFFEKMKTVHFVTAAAFLPLPRPNKDCTIIDNDHTLHHAFSFGDGPATISVAVAGHPGDDIVVVIGNNNNNADDDDSHGLHYNY